MIPLPMATPGEENIIRKIGGSQEVRRHLESLGFTVGGNAMVVASMCGNVIVRVRETRVAINEDMARRIMI